MIENQFFNLKNFNSSTFPIEAQSIDDYKDYCTKEFLVGFRLQLLDWLNNYNNEENTKERLISNFVHPTTEELQNEINKIEQALMQKYEFVIS